MAKLGDHITLKSIEDNLQLSQLKSARDENTLQPSFRLVVVLSVISGFIFTVCVILICKYWLKLRQRNRTRSNARRTSESTFAFQNTPLSSGVFRRLMRAFRKPLDAASDHSISHQHKIFRVLRASDRKHSNSQHSIRDCESNITCTAKYKPICNEDARKEIFDNNASSQLMAVRFSRERDDVCRGLVPSISLPAYTKLQYYVNFANEKPLVGSSSFHSGCHECTVNASKLSSASQENRQTLNNSLRKNISQMMTSSFKSTNHQHTLTTHRIKEDGGEAQCCGCSHVKEGVDEERSSQALNERARLCLVSLAEKHSPAKNIILPSGKRKAHSCGDSIYKMSKMSVKDGPSPKFHSQIGKQGSISCEDGLFCRDDTRKTLGLSKKAAEGGQQGGTLYPNMSSQCRQLWVLRSQFENDDSDEAEGGQVEMDESIEASHEQHRFHTRYVPAAWSFESKTDKRSLIEGEVEATNETTDGTSPSSSSQGRIHSSLDCAVGGGSAKRLTNLLLQPPNSKELGRKQSFRNLLARRRLQHASKPDDQRRKVSPCSNENSLDSFDTLETDDGHSDTSRHELVTTSFESTTDNTDSVGELGQVAAMVSKLQQIGGDSGYKSLDVSQQQQQNVIVASQSCDQTSRPLQEELKQRKELRQQLRRQVAGTFDEYLVSKQGGCASTKDVIEKKEDGEGEEISANFAENMLTTLENVNSLPVSPPNNIILDQTSLSKASSMNSNARSPITSEELRIKINPPVNKSPTASPNSRNPKIPHENKSTIITESKSPTNPHGNRSPLASLGSRTSDTSRHGAAKRRKDYGKERQLGRMLESIVIEPGELETDSKSDPYSGEESFENIQTPAHTPTTTAPPAIPPPPPVTSPPAESLKASLTVSYARRSRAGGERGGTSGVRAQLSRDYSIDEKTDAIYNEFLRYDPRLDKRHSYSYCGGASSGGGVHKRQHSRRLNRRQAARVYRHMSSESVGGTNNILCREGNTSHSVDSSSDSHKNKPRKQLKMTSTENSIEEEEITSAEFGTGEAARETSSDVGANAEGTNLLKVAFKKSIPIICLQDENTTTVTTIV